MSDADRLALAMNFVPSEWREDAMQEAALARLEGRNPVAAVDNFRKRIARRARREFAASDIIDRMSEQEDQTEFLVERDRAD